MKKSILLVTALAFLQAYAQKLPKVQTAGVRAPANIKIDGKLTEWNDQFQAYNTGQHIYYTISNDDNNLYLSARMDGALGSRKIFKGGLTFAILPLSKESDKLAITFPITNVGFMKSTELGGMPFQEYKLLTKKNTAGYKAKIDSLVASNNAGIKKTYKNIYIKGMPGVSDPSVPIYNTLDIAAGAGFDKNMNYTYELAIPLKHLKGSISDDKKLKYVIGLNALSPFTRDHAKPPAPGATELKVATQLAPEAIDDTFIYNDTDFSGEYTLAK